MLGFSLMGSDYRRSGVHENPSVRPNAEAGIMCEPIRAGSRQRSVSLRVWADCLLTRPVEQDGCSGLANVGSLTVIEIRILAYA